MVRTSRLVALGMAVVFVMGLSACGSSDDDEGVAGDSATGTAACQPVGADLKATAVKTVPVELKEYSFTPATVDVAAGVVTFAATNNGTLNHELAFLPGGGEVPLTTAGTPDEDALGTAGAFELEAFGSGLSLRRHLRPEARHLHPVLHRDRRRRPDPSPEGHAGQAHRRLDAEPGAPGPPGTPRPPPPASYQRSPFVARRTDPGPPPPPTAPTSGRLRRWAPVRPRPSRRR